MSSSSLRVLTKKRLSHKEAWKVIRSIHSLDHRTMVLALTSLLEQGLEKLIISKMKKLPPSAKEALFFGVGPLATLSAKIRIAVAFGIIGERVGHDLEAFNDIRNAFAHSAHILTFRNRRVVKRLEGISLWGTASMWGNVVPHLEDVERWQKKLYPTVKGKYFTMMATYILALNDVQLDNYKKRKRARNFLFAPPLPPV